MLYYVTLLLIGSVSLIACLVLCLLLLCVVCWFVCVGYSLYLSIVLFNSFLLPYYLTALTLYH